MTKEQELISQRNKRKARKYFNIIGQSDLVLHHINPDWKHNDIERYIQWNPEDLIVMTRAAHLSLHHKGKVLSQETKDKISAAKSNISDETRLKMSIAAKNRGANNKGMHFSEEARKHMSEARKGKTPWNKGLKLKNAD